jgi:hypothetical protein
MSNLSSECIEILRRVQKTLDKAPDNFQMARFKTVNECNTAYCIAGHILTMFKHEIEEEGDYRDGELAAKILGINSTQANNLFFLDHWPDQFQMGYEGNDNSFPIESTPEFAANGIARIEHFIKTDGEE